MVSEKITCYDVNVALYTDDSYSVNANGVESLDIKHLLQ
jgi:hypothetical protein